MLWPNKQEKTGEYFWIFLPVQHLIRYSRICIMKWRSLRRVLFYISQYKKNSPVPDTVEIIFMSLSLFLSEETCLPIEVWLVHCIALSLYILSLYCKQCWLEVHIHAKTFLFSYYLSHKYYVSWREWYDLLLSLYTKKIKMCAVQVVDSYCHLLCAIIWYQTS